MDRESLYLQFPICIQNCMVSLEGLRIQQKRYSKVFFQFLNEYESRLTMPLEKLLAFRDQRLRVFVRHCVESVPYYRRLFKDLGLKASDIRSAEDLVALPILTKEVVQEHGPDMISEAIPKSERIITHTSGTTGGGLRFATTHKALSEQWAVWWRYRRLHGIERDTWCGYFGGRSIVPLSQTRPPFWRYNWPGRQLLFSGYHMTPDNLDTYLGELRRRRPSWLHGYPSLLSLLANRILDTGLDLDYKVNWITTGAENLLLQQSDIIEKAFGVRPLQHYGLSEAVANISEWPDGRLRVDEDFSVVEFVPTLDGQSQRIIGTNLSNLATPLLRYDTCDLAEIEPDQIDFDQGGRIIKNIDGRMEDYIVLQNGAKLGRMDHIFKDMTAIREAQLYQKKPGQIEISIVKGKDYRSIDEARLLREFRKRVGRKTELKISYYDALPRSRTGKLRFVVSEILREKIDAIPH